MEVLAQAYIQKRRNHKSVLSPMTTPSFLLTTWKKLLLLLVVFPDIPKDSIAAHATKSLQQEVWAEKSLPPALLQKLNTQIAKELYPQYFRSETRFCHILLPVLRWNFLDEHSLASLTTAYPLTADAVDLIHQAKTFDTTLLRGHHHSTKYDTPHIMFTTLSRRYMVAFMEQDLWTPRVVQTIGWQHTASHRNPHKIINLLAKTNTIKHDVLFNLAQVLQPQSHRRHPQVHALWQP